MKNALVFALLLWAAAASAQAVSDINPLKKHEAYFSYSPPVPLNDNGPVFNIGKPAIDYAELGPNERLKYASLGSVQMGHRYFLSKRFSLGLEFLYQHVTRNKYAGGVQEYAITRDFLQSQLRFDYHYPSGSKVQLYSGFAIGLMISKESFLQYDVVGNVTSREVNWKFNRDGIPVQLHLLGVRFGQKTAVFGEFGLGHTLVRVGVARRF